MLSPFLMAMLLSAGPNELPLWTGDVPESKGKPEANRPTVTLFAPAKDKSNGAACVVCPGGGYGFLADDHEGKQVAEWLVARGVTAFVLKYRIVGKDRPGPLHPAPLLDAQRAVRLVRARAAEFGVDPKRIGIWGFSAGGHLASSAATHFDDGKTDATDPIDRVSCRPDFAILSYPVISMMDGTTHGGSRKNLLGDKPDPELVKHYSNDLQVTAKTPPTFLFHTQADTSVVPANSRLFYEALKKHNVPAEIHIYEKGVHGVGLGSDPKWTKGEKSVATWPTRLEEWLKSSKFLDRR